MTNYNLNIAGYNIRLESASDGPDLSPSPRFHRYIIHNNKPDITIVIHSGIFDLPEGAERVFHAPFVEEINGFLVRHKPNFWSVWKEDEQLFIKTIFPLTVPERNAVLKFSLSSAVWDLWIDGPNTTSDPFEYPIDGLILYYLTVIYGDIMIHSSGVNYKGQGFLFSGVSGKGKSTLARLWDEYGAKVIHDDRLIVRKTKDGYQMHNTPVYNNEEPAQATLSKLFIIEHGTENLLTPVRGAAAVSMVMANCIQHNWGQEIIGRLLTSITSLCMEVPVEKLSFLPERSVIDYILENE